MQDASLQRILLIKEKFDSISSYLNERALRIWCATEVKNYNKEFNRGGSTTVHRATGISYPTIRAGLREIKSKKKLNVIFIPQVTSQLFDDDDRSVAKRIIVKMKEKSFVWGIEQEMSHYEIKSFYANMNYIVGTRFHSVIFSLTSYVPAVAIEYEHKTRGIMKDLDLTDWVIKLEDLTAERLIKKFDKLVLKQEEYIASLKAQIPSYIKDARGAVDTIKQVVLLKDN